MENMRKTKLLPRKRRMRGNDIVMFKTNSMWKMYPDPKSDAIIPKWWHKLIFWKKWNYQHWKIRREYKKLSEML